MTSENAHIMPIVGEKPSHYAERLGRAYADASFQKDKKHKGQFFTPLPIARFMGGLATPSTKKTVSVLDPGCGLAILSCALIEHLIEESSPETISLSLYETDSSVIPHTQLVLAYLMQWGSEQGVQLNCQLNESDFVLNNSESLDESDTIFGNMTEYGNYDYIIS